MLLNKKIKSQVLFNKIKMLFSKKKIKSQVEKLSLEPGDLVVLRTDRDWIDWAKVMKNLIQIIKRTKKIDVTAIVLPIETRFGKITERTMNRAGWFKQDKVEVKRILDDNIMLRYWNVAIKKLHIDDAMKAHDIQEELKERLKKYEDEKG